MRSYILPALAVLGLSVAVYAVIDTNRAPPVQTLVTPSVAAPFGSYVSGSGITESGRGNVVIGTPVFGVVKELYVKVGDQVLSGDPLFKIDDQDLQARLQVARAKVIEAEAALAKPKHRLEFLTHLQNKDASAISRQAMSEVRDDARVAESILGSAKASVAQIEIDVSRSVVHAPAAGRILQVNTRIGEYAEGNGQSKPLILLGDDTRVYLRVDIDESNAWRVKPNARAHAYVRGNPQLHGELRFEYIEPFVTAKTSLTGQSTERSDVRVLQVIYSFSRDTMPVYIGQQMDVFIEAPSVAPTSNKRKP